MSRPSGSSAGSQAVALRERASLVEERVGLGAVRGVHAPEPA